jgi:hypothetical protein
VILYLVAKSSHTWADVDGLACSLHRPMAYNCQRGSQSLLTGAALSCHDAVGSAIFLWGAKSPGLNILHGVDRLGTYKTESYMRSPPLPWACLSNVRVIMVIMLVPLVESLCQAAMRWIPELAYLLPGVRGECGHVLSCQTVNAAASRDPDAW